MPGTIDEHIDKALVVHRLIKESEVNNDYYLLLVVSTLITTVGLIINNAAVVIGGMLISPLLSPLLALGLAIITNHRDSLKRSLTGLTKSMLTVFVVSFVTAFVLGVNAPLNEEILLRTKATLPYVYIAVLSGTAATYAWAKPKLSASLPGVAVAIALLPPLCVTGIGLSLFNREVMTGSLQMFLVNLSGMVGSATVIFSLFGFHEMKEVEEVEVSKEKISQGKGPVQANTTNS